MLTVTLADGSKKKFDSSITVQQLAQNISTSLAKSAIAGKVDGRIVDLFYPIEKDAEVVIITEKDPEGLEVIRHSTAHLLAQAVKQLYPTAQVTIGPVIEDGFYYDFAFARPFTPDDLEQIEAKMKSLAKQKLTVERRELPRDAAIKYFQQLGETYKAKIIAEIPQGERISLYKQGDFEDLCRGPHVPDTGYLKAFKLTKVAGAYWRGDANNEMLQRIYGTAWADQASLKAYLDRLEQAEKRDHRKLGKQLNLFHLQEEAPGMAFWHPKGWTVYQIIEKYLVDLLARFNYQQIHTPQLIDRSLWEKSGHWAMFSEEMFTTQTDNHIYAIKPMSCPGHVQVFKQGIKSYRDLPIRFAEFGNCHRSEPSGALHGLMRVRNFVQDDGHIFCAEAQIQAEVTSFIDLVYRIYQDFGFDDIILKFSSRPDHRVGSDTIWDKAEHALTQALRHTQLEWEHCLGEGAFYGPKIEFSLRDCLGRVWQCGTIQVDFSMPERLEAHYIAEDGSKQVPVMLHRAALGSIERFLGILIEHYAGVFPVWLAPVQVIIMNITDDQADYAREVADYLTKAGIRADLDLRNEKIGFKIREHTLQRIPYLLILGNQEVRENKISVRSLDGRNLGAMSHVDFLNQLNAEIGRRGRLQRA